MVFYQYLIYAESEKCWLEEHMDRQTFNYPVQRCARVSLFGTIIFLVKNTIRFISIYLKHDRGTFFT